VGPRSGDVEGDALRAEAGFHAGHPAAYEPGKARAVAVSDLAAAKLWLAEGPPPAA
jgi:hypothetical protein